MNFAIKAVIGLGNFNSISYIYKDVTSKHHMIRSLSPVQCHQRILLFLEILKLFGAVTVVHLYDIVNLQRIKRGAQVYLKESNVHCFHSDVQMNAI